MILLLGGEKGGSGKSCLAQNLAVWIKARGGDVLLLDADPQGTTADWAAERNDQGDLPPIRGLGSNGTENQRKHELEFALLVCDC